jgi:hypothetical protein
MGIASKRAAVRHTPGPFVPPQVAPGYEPEVRKKNRKKIK